MRLLGGILDILDCKMTAPVPYGGFHIFFFALSIFAGIILCKRFQNADEKFVRRMLFVVSLAVILLEAYKQINFSFQYDGESITFDYQWYAFPFQFCSTPMYIGMLAAIIKDKRIHESLCAYLGTYAFFAGLCVMFYPTTVFVDTIGINIQTMICHGSMITIGIYLLYSGYVKTGYKTVFKALPVFIILVTMAIVMNEIAYQTGLLETETFNMFFLSPYCAPELPVYSLIQGVIPFPWCALTYIIGFTLAGYALLHIFAFIKHITFQIKNRKNRHKMQCSKNKRRASHLSKQT